MSDENTSPLEPASEVRILVTTAPPDVAEDLAHALVDLQLAACVNLVTGVRSVYRWEGAVQNDPETLLLVKTTASRLAEAVDALRERHPYDVPEVLVLPPEAGSAAYLSWLRTSVR